MANAPVVVTHASGGSCDVGKLFEGLSFFLVQRVPTRSRFVQDIEANGGKVVKTEAVADYVIADHMRPDAPGGSYSYTFLETAIREGTLPNPGDHATGRARGSARAVGSTSIAAKSTRTPFTLDDDHTLWRWVQKEKALGASVKGHEIYKRLEAANPRHTHQSWRDRYIKKLIDNPPAGAETQVVGDASQSPTPVIHEQKTAAPDAVRGERRQSPRKRRRLSVERDHEGVSQTPLQQNGDTADIALLMGEAEDIELIVPGRETEAWDSFATAYPQRTAKGWREFYLATVRPMFCAGRGEPTESGKDAIAGIRPSPDRAAPVKKRKLGSPQTDGTASELTTGTERQVSVIEHNEARTRQQLGTTNSAPKLTEAPVDVSDADQIDSSEDDSSGDEGIDPQLPADRIETDVANPDIEEKAGAFEEVGIALPDIRAENDSLQDSIETSDVNHTADMQLQIEASAEREEADDKLSRFQNSLDDLEGHRSKIGQNTSPTNEAPRELVDTADPNTEASGTWQPRAQMTKHVSKDLFGRPRSDTPTPSLAAAIEEQNRVEARSAAIEIAGFALTEANLAAQEGQLRTSKTRGVDLPEDDEMKDQSAFLMYLQKTMGVPVTQPDIEEDADDEQADLLDNRSTALDTAGFNATRGAVVRSRPTDGHLSPFSSNSKVEYPEENHDYDSLNGAEQDDFGNGEIDLTIPEPEGGFGLSSPKQSPRYGPLFEPEERLEETSPIAQSLIRTPSPKPKSNPVVYISSTSLPSSSLVSSVESDHVGRHPGPGDDYTGHAVGTQDIYNAETQLPDLVIPDPPGWDDDSEDGHRVLGHSPVSPSHHGAQSKSQTQLGSSAQAREPRKAPNVEDGRDDIGDDKTSSSQDDAAKLEDWMATMKVRNYTERLLIQALKCSSMRLDLAHLVLLSIKSGQGLPDDVAGIWSEQEDRILESGDAEGIQRLDAKHGWRECEARLKYLMDWREA